MMNLASISAVQPQTAQTFYLPWATLLIVLAGIMVLMLAIRSLGLILARRHPISKPVSPSPPAAPTKEVPRFDLPPQMVAVLAAALSTVFHGPYRITKIEAKQDYSVEALMNIWSMEGRRQIYDSHRIR
jgi:hypothetical protein